MVGPRAFLSATPWNCTRPRFVVHGRMENRFSCDHPGYLCVEERVAHTIGVWNRCAAQSGLVFSGPVSSGLVFSGLVLPKFSEVEQRRREDAYDHALSAVEREAKRAPRGKVERHRAQGRVVQEFSRFATIALGLEDEAVRLLTNGFLPIGIRLARWARRFDPSLSMADTVQACRNAWTACGLQPLLGDAMHLSPSILGYSLLYPYSDNYLDGAEVTAREKLRFSARFRERLCGGSLSHCDAREAAIWTMIQLIEEQYPRARYPQVWDCLLAIHRAQETSIAQQKSCHDSHVLRISCAKGGTSVLADACLSHGSLDDEESRFAFEWGVLLQFGDDLQDVREDLKCGSETLFSRAASMGEPLDNLVLQLLRFSEHAATRMDRLPHGTAMFKGLLRMSWRSLILMAVASAQEFFTPDFAAELERCSPFRFGFLRARHKRLAGRQGLYAMLFESFVEDEANDLRDGQILYVSHMTLSPDGKKAKIVSEDKRQNTTSSFETVKQ
jgi:hypothetical protein